MKRLNELCETLYVAIAKYMRKLVSPDTGRILLLHVGYYLLLKAAFGNTPAIWARNRPSLSFG